MLKKLIISLVLFVASGALAQSDRSISAVSSLEQFRPPGDRRVWTFFGNDSTFGSLMSTVVSRTEVDGLEGLLVEQSLNVDFTKIRGLQKVVEKRQFSVAYDGTYLSDQIAMGTIEAPETFQLIRSGDSLVGFYTRAGSRIEQSIYSPSGQPAWDNYYADQLEMILALKDISVGATITDTIFHPHSLYASPFVARVADFVREEIYRDRFDSVFFLIMSQPFEAHLLFTADRRLIKIDMRNQSYRIYQDDVRMVDSKLAAQTARRSDPSFSWIKLVALIPHYIAYLVLAALVILVIVRNVFKWKFSYLSILFGIGGLVIASFTQFPLQQYLMISLIAPALATGDPAFFASLLPSMAGGIIQTGIILGLLLWMVRIARPTRTRYAVLGACIGAGFAIAEASYQLGFQVIPLFSSVLAERGFFILFHVSVGALIGHSLTAERNITVASILAALLVNSVLRYLPVFAMARIADPQLLLIITGGVSLLFAAVVLVQISRIPARSTTTD